MKRTLSTACALAFVTIGAFAQPTTAPEFEAASVKRAASQAAAPPMQLPSSVREQMGFEGGPGTSDPGRIHYHGVTLMMLLVRAYNLKPDQISGPDWLDEERYTIDATLAPGANADQLRVMLQKPRGTLQNRPMRDTSKPANGNRQDETVIPGYGR
jgi:hypothetical protein